MDQKTICRLVSLAGLAVAAVGNLLSGWADEKQQDIVIEEKVMKALAAINRK